MTDKAMISVVVPFRNAGTYARMCIDGLLGQDYPKERFELLFVDSGSTDGSCKLIEGYEGVQCLRCPEVGPYPARNYGIQRSQGEIIALTDIDCVPSPNWLSNMASQFQDPRIGIVLGAVQFSRRNTLLRALENYENNKAEWICQREDAGRYFGYANNMAISRDWITKVGLFEAIMRGADTVFVQRLIGQGGTDLVRYAEEVRVEHLEIDSVSAWARKRYIYGRSSQNYNKMVSSRPLTLRERWAIFMLGCERYQYGLGMCFVALATLFAGLLCFKYAHCVARFQKTNSSSEEVMHPKAATEPTPRE